MDICDILGLLEAKHETETIKFINLVLDDLIEVKNNFDDEYCCADRLKQRQQNSLTSGCWMTLLEQKNILMMNTVVLTDFIFYLERKRKRKEEREL